jgi:hypothetical protein
MAKGKYGQWLTYEGLTLLEGWARDGLTDEQIAENIGINRDTLYTWKKKYSDISDALKSGKEVADFQVENAMHKAATGFYYYEDAVTNKGDVVSVKKYQPPNATLNIFWSKNRRPDRWRDKQEHDVNANVGVNIIDDIGEDDE